jgi:hypothetical protein
MNAISPDRSFLEIPVELVVGHILPKLKIEDLQQMTCVCKKAQLLADDERLRKWFFDRDFPGRQPLKFRNIEVNNSKEQYEYAHRLRLRLHKDIHKHVYQNFGNGTKITSFENEKKYCISGSEGEIIITPHDKSLPSDSFPSSNGKFILDGDSIVYADGNLLKVRRENAVHTVNCNGPIRSFFVEPGHFIVDSHTGTLKVWMKGELECTEVFSLNNVSMSYASNKHLFVVLMNGTMKIWKMDENGRYQSLQKIENASPSSEYPIDWIRFVDGSLVAGCRNGSFKHWVADGIFKEIQILEGKAFADVCSVTSSCFNGNHLILGFENGDLVIYTQVDSNFESTWVYMKDQKGVFLVKQIITTQSEVTGMDLQYNHLFTGHADHAVIWELNAQGKYDKIRQLSIQSSKKKVSFVQVKDGRFTVGYVDGSIRHWDFSPQDFRL